MIRSLLFAYKALHNAAENGDAEAVSQLLAAGADKDAKEKLYGSTPLMLAASNGHTNVVSQLLAAGANKDAKDKFGNTALHDATIWGHVEVVSQLLAARVNTDGKDKDGNTAFSWAILKGRARIVSLLLAAGIDKEAKDEDGNTALHMAAFKGHANLVSQLLAAGANRDAVNNHGETALSVAASKGKGKAASQLLLAGADWNTKIRDGSSAISTLLDKNILDRDGLIQLCNNDSTFVDLLRKQRAERGDTNIFRLLLKLSSTDFDVASVNIFPLLNAHSYFLWFELLLQDLLTAQTARKFIDSYPQLAKAVDAEGRTAMDMARGEVKAFLQSLLLWHGRYRLTEAWPQHTSATCVVFKANDEQSLNSEGKPTPVALKLLLNKDQFLREVEARNRGLDNYYVVDILQMHPDISSSPTKSSKAAKKDILDAYPDTVNISSSSSGENSGRADFTSPTTMDHLSQYVLTSKGAAEKLFCIAMPFKDRNLYVALKQERWAGRDMVQVRHIFFQLAHCVSHLHSKRLIHGDIKPLNIVRKGVHWLLIDLDASCTIGVDHVGQKSSSAYVPPEAIHSDEETGFIQVTTPADPLPLIAHPSFDIWSLGCLLYQMCHPQVTSLFQADREDNLSDSLDKPDSLWVLQEWSNETKTEKLSEIDDRLARNLLSQLLQKDPTARPSVERVLSHPFVTGKTSAVRLVGEKANFDVFLSYRVASDSYHAEKLYDLLTARGLKVWWDKKCLKPGVNWEDGCCDGLVDSRAFICLLSRNAINHPHESSQNFSDLLESSNCDNMFLECRMALELQALGLIERVFPVMIGDIDEVTGAYTNYFRSGCHPRLLPDISVDSVESQLFHHMESSALGTPLVAKRTVASVLNAIASCQGGFIEGEGNENFVQVADTIHTMMLELDKAAAAAAAQRSSAISPPMGKLLRRRRSHGGGGAGGSGSRLTSTTASSVELDKLPLRQRPRSSVASSPGKGKQEEEGEGGGTRTRASSVERSPRLVLSQSQPTTRPSSGSKLLRDIELAREFDEKLEVARIAVADICSTSSDIPSEGNHRHQLQQQQQVAILSRIIIDKDRALTEHIKTIAEKDQAILDRETLIAKLEAQLASLMST